MESSGVRRAWGERESATGQCSASASAPNWSSVLVEELLETNTTVIADRSMAVLKELELPAASMDPALMSDLRHNKEILSSISASRTLPTNSEIMMEAKRVLKREERVKNSLTTQNRIVDEEVDRFQNHIRSLRKMNQRLERIAFPAVKRKPNKINYGFLKSPYCMSSGLGIEKLSDDQEQRALRKKLPNKNTGEKSDETQESKYIKRNNLSIAGNKMDGHDIIQHKPIALSQTSAEYQNTVFEKIHQRYMESERNRVLKDGTSLIRHTSPINDSEQTDHQGATASLKALTKSELNHKVQLREWVEETSDSRVPTVENSEVCLGEWSSPRKTTRDSSALQKTNKSERSTTPPSIFPPAVVSQKGDKNKLESLSKMYAKWMTKVCVSTNSKFEDYGCFQNKLENTRERSSNKHPQLSSISREEKIMQVLQALQRNKESKQSDIQDAGGKSNSRFSKSVNDVREEKTEFADHKFRRAISGSYEHRLKAHKELISHQKTKLEEQQKEIEDLKFSQLRMESEKSRMVTQKNLDEVLKNCSKNVTAKAKSLQSSLSLADLSPGNDFVLRMERRAIEQKQRKVLAQERRKQIEEERKKKVQELEEKKRQEEEEILRKNHEEALEMRRKEREMRDDARKEREKIIVLERKADFFCSRRRLRNGLLGFKRFLSLRKIQEESAAKFYDHLLMQNALKVWKTKVEWSLQAKMECADFFYSSNLLHRCFNALKWEVQERDRCMQVAMDLHDFHLQERYFHIWLKFAGKQQEIESEKMAKAEHHFSNVLVRRYLHMWQKYPKVAQLEREKERRKMLWRNKVQQVLPDFRPVLSSD